MSENALLNMKKNNLMKALNREGADYVPTMLAASCAMVSWAGKKVTDIIDDPEAYLPRGSLLFWSLCRINSDPTV